MAKVSECNERRKKKNEKEKISYSGNVEHLLELHPKAS